MARMMARGSLSFITVGLLLFLLASYVGGSRILLVGIPTGSHIMSIQQIGEALLHAGHEVDVVTDVSCRSTKKLVEAGLRIQAYETTGCTVDNKELDEKMMKALVTEPSISNKLEQMKLVDIISSSFTDVLFQNETLLKILKSRNYDLCIVDGLQMIRFLYIIPYKLNVPFLSFLTVFNPKYARVPGLPSFTPIIEQGEYTDEMNFFQRFINTLDMFVMEEMLLSRVPSLGEGIASLYAPERPYKPLTEIIRSSQLWLVQNDVAIDYPRVSLPHVVDVGGLNTRPPKPLPDNFQKMADAATNGLIIVSFGSMISGLPGEVSVRLLNDLRKLKQTVVWRHDGKNLKDVPSHVKLVNWLPQNDLLAHPNTKVFVTHCGANGQLEALYNSVPMVGLPLFGDQMYNAKRIVKNGLGLHLDMFNFKPGELHSAIEEVMNNGSYKFTMALRSRVFKDRPMTPKERVVYWVEHVIKYGSKHLVSPAVTMPWYQFWCFDILFSCFVAMLLLMFLIYKVLCCLVRAVFRKISKESTTVKAGRKEKKQ